MDTKLRDLERQAISDPEARLKLVAEKQRLGYREFYEQIGTVHLSSQEYSPESFMDAIHSCIKEKHHQKYHRFSLYFSAQCDGPDYDGYDHGYDYGSCDFTSMSVMVSGVRLETDKELKRRQKAEEKQREAEKARRRSEAARRKQEKEKRKQAEWETYERLKRKFETEEKIQNLLNSIGTDAESSLREYSPGYFKSWFHRKFKKLNGKTPLEVYDDGDIDKLRRFALKAL